MFNFVLSLNKKYFYVLENPSIRADLNGNVYGGGGGGDEPQVQEAPLSEQEQAAWGEWQKYMPGYFGKQWGLYEDIFEPMTRQLGGFLGEQLTAERPELAALSEKLMAQLEQPLSLPEEVWARTWQKGRERTAAGYQPARQQAGERAAGAGMLGQGPTEQYMQALDLSQAKSVEDLAVDMAISEWNEKKQAQQQSIQNMQQFLPMQANIRQQPISNMMGFLSGQPQFNLPMPVPQQYMTGGQGDGGMGWGGGAMTGAAAGSMFGPWGTAIGAGVGGLGGGMGWW